MYVLIRTSKNQIFALILLVKRCLVKRACLGVSSLVVCTVPRFSLHQGPAQCLPMVSQLIFAGWMSQDTNQPCATIRSRRV